MDARSTPWHRFPARLVAARMSCGMTQLGLAKECGREGNSWIAMLEDGSKGRMPGKMEDVRLIAEVTGVPMEWLLFGHVFGKKQGPLAIGLGGPAVEVRGMAVSELALHPGKWLGDDAEPGGELLLVDCMPFVGNGQIGRGRYLLDRRGEAIVMTGKLNDRRQLVDAKGELLSRSRVVGICCGRAIKLYPEMVESN